MADDDEDISIFPVITLTIVIGAAGYLIYFIANFLKQLNEESSKKKDEVVEEVSEKVSSGGTKHKRERVRSRGSSKKTTFTHPWLITTLKGHGGRVLDMDFSDNGKYLASCADDRTVFLWMVKYFDKSGSHSMRHNCEFDHARRICWSPDSTAYIIYKEIANTVEVFKVTKKPDGMPNSITSALEFKKHGDEEVIGLGIACTGRYIMTCTNKTQIVIWDLKGNILTEVDNRMMQTYCAKISPCGRFVATSGFTPDVKVWEVEFTKSNTFDKMSRAFELKGHTAGIYSFSFNTDSTVVATVSKDGTWRLYDLKIEYKLHQEPYLLMKGVYHHVEGLPTHVALSPDGRTVAIATGDNVNIYSGVTGREAAELEGVHTEHITGISFDRSGRYLVTCGDKQIRVLHNMVGYHALIQDLDEKVKTARGSMRTRIEDQINEAKKTLKELNKNIPNSPAVKLN